MSRRSTRPDADGSASTDPDRGRAKVFGVGLNKTGTKTLAHYLRELGYRNRTYDSVVRDVSPSFDLWHAGRTDQLLDILDDYDSAEDWPWPLLYRELDERFPDARFLLTVRASPERWYASLCNMAVRIGPLPLYEAHVYGSAMPHGHRAEHLRIYAEHNAAVRAHFAGRPGKLLELCWDCGDDVSRLGDFLGLDTSGLDEIHINASPDRGVYTGEDPRLAWAGRIGYQHLWGPRSELRTAARGVRRRLRGR